MSFTHTNIITPVEIKSRDSQTGRVYITPEGNKYPSVTTVLNAGEKVWLSDWIARLGPEKAAKETKRCADRGTAVHLMAERYLNNEVEENIIKGQTLDHINEFNPLRLYLKSVDNIYTQETPLWSDVLKIAGRVDCIAEYNGKLSIIDFKTSNNNKSEEMINDYFLQTTAYALMFEERYGITIEDIVIIMTVQRGVVPLIFKKKIHDYIEPLVERVCQYHQTHEVK